MQSRPQTLKNNERCKEPKDSPNRAILPKMASSNPRSFKEGLQYTAWGKRSEEASQSVQKELQNLNMF